MGIDDRRRYLVTGVLRVILVLGLLMVAGLGTDRILRIDVMLSALEMGIGVALIVSAGALEAWSIRTLWIQGRGTPHPACPPEELVTGGPYAFSRNPLYLARVVFLLGAAVLLASPGVLLVGVSLLLVVHLVVIPREERKLQARFGKDFEAYTRRVRRWVGERRGGG